MDNVELKPMKDDRWAILAGLRFLLASIVMCGHICALFPECRRVLWPLADCGGFPAVLGFFIISGYSIAASLDRPDHFYARRIWRIWPVYIACLLIAATSYIAGHGWTSVANPATLPFVIAFNAVALLGVAGSWSLRIEVVYYAFGPLLKKAPPILISALIALSVAAYLFHADWPTPFYQDWFGVTAISCAWAWLIGFALYTRKSIISVAALLVLPAILVRFTSEEMAPYASYLMIAVSLIIVSAPKLRAGKCSRALLWFGDLSYPLYLMHMGVITYVLAAKLSLPLPVLALPFACIAASALVLYAVDYPTRKLAKLIIDVPRAGNAVHRLRKVARVA